MHKVCVNEEIKTCDASVSLRQRYCKVIKVSFSVILLNNKKKLKNSTFPPKNKIAHLLTTRLY